KNTTEAINLITRGLNFERGDKIIASILDHHSNLVPWQQLQSKKGVDLEVIERAPDGIIDPSAVRAAIDENTKIVTMPWISNALGTRQPVKEIGKITKDEGVLFCIDAAQAAGNVPMNVKEIGCDFLVAPGHKGILGPQGTGFAYIKEEKVREIEPLLYGGGMVKSADSMTCKLVDPPQIFDAGTPNIPGIIGLGRAIEYIQEIGLEKIEEREKKLVRKMLSINEVDGVEVYGSKKAKERGGAISFNIKGINSHEVSSLLDELENIATRSGNHCAMPALQSLGLKESVRASVHYFNTEKETEKFAETIGTIASELAD
ncbi:MAG: aminotransferase class V-fold PLP-dependent enzyme, partial [Candidatus Hadarchaeia archaeon]